jgi:uncharacterized RDD family membrane protein YckC
VTIPPEPVDAPAPAIRPLYPGPPNPYPGPQNQYPGPQNPYPGPGGDAPLFAPMPPGMVPLQPMYGPPQAGFTTPQAGYGSRPGFYPQQIPVSPSGHRLAEFSDRLLARLIDAAVVGVVAAIFLGPIYFLLFFSLIRGIPTETTVNGNVVSPELFDPTSFFLRFLGFFLAALALGLVINYLYQVEMMFRSGQTVGKRIMKIRVLPVDPGHTLTRGMAFKRFVAEYGANFLPGFGWVDGLWQLWDKPWRQCLHDKFAETLVIKLNP